MIQVGDLMIMTKPPGQVGDLMIMTKPQASAWGHQNKHSSLGEAICGNLNTFTSI